ncbi:nicotinamide-nucleotide amidase [Proteus vulgaris]|uniref:nicotinamide-nucleotide amidase n=1 Tax=Proteus vulgaris TaxID=585 RepID=UPI0018E49BE3|nr:nicotinamide-nucleotide amidase [Proteus vulgaris]MBI6527513.1 nicotinamide-nucleotide amidase [Proteus vulgaris]
MINYDEMTHLSIEVGKALIEKKSTITTAESCTGGWIAKIITDIAGSSDYYHRGFVTYSNEAKHEMIGVDEQTLIKYGAVSEEVVLQMAKGALSAANADFAVSVSGIAGPGGGSKEKPVGLVWFGFAVKTTTGIQVTAKHCIFSGSREQVRAGSVVFSLKSILKEIINN